MKIKTLTVTAYKTLDRKNGYQVVRATDTTEHLPKDCIDQTRMDFLCMSPEWKITIVEAK